MSSYRIGIDVGGTNTDAVILNEAMEGISATKIITQDNVSDAI